MHVILFDGVCGLCDRLVSFVIDHDTSRSFRFAALQSAFATEALARHRRHPRDLNTLFVLCDFGTPRERVLLKSDGALLVLRELGGVWRAMALWSWVPRPIRDAVYDLVAVTRYRLFGRRDACRVPTVEERELFLDATAGAP